MPEVQGRERTLPCVRRAGLLGNDGVRHPDASRVSTHLWKAQAMIRSRSYAARLRREALRLMRDAWSQAQLVCDYSARGSPEQSLRAGMCADMARTAERIFERLRKAGF